MSSFVANSPVALAPDASVNIDPASIPTLGDLTAANTPVEQSYDRLVSEFSDSTGQNSIEAAADQQLAAEGQDAGASPVAEPGTTASTPPIAPAAPQLDATTQLLMAELQASRAAQAQQQAQFAQLLQQFAPKPAPEPVADPFADLPEKFNTPEIKEFLKVAQDKILSPYQKQLEGRIQAAQHERLTNQFASEAEQAANAVIASGYELEGNDAAIVKDGLRDFALTLSHVHGGSPAQYKDALARVADSLVRGRQAHMNKAAKAKVSTMARPATQNAARAIPQGQQSADYTWAEARAAGYRDMTDAVFDDGKKVLAMRARQGRS